MASSSQINAKLQYCNIEMKYGFIELYCEKRADCHPKASGSKLKHTRIEIHSVVVRLQHN
jgi:hypothetical protein